MKLRILITALFSLVCAQVAAEPVLPLKDQPLYWGVSYSAVDFTVAGANDDAKLGAITGRFGYQYSDMLGAELRYTRGVRDQDINGIVVDLDQMYGVYGKINLLTDIDLTPYAILGYTQAEASTVGGTGEDSDFSYGIGFDFCSDQPICLNAEYMSYVGKDTFDVSGFNIGLKINF